MLILVPVLRLVLRGLLILITNAKTEADTHAGARADAADADPGAVADTNADVDVEAADDDVDSSADPVDEWAICFSQTQTVHNRTQGEGKRGASAAQ